MGAGFSSNRAVTHPHSTIQRLLAKSLGKKLNSLVVNEEIFLKLRELPVCGVASQVM